MLAKAGSGGDHDEYQIDRAGEAFTATVGGDGECSGIVARYRGDGGGGEDFDAVGLEFGPHQVAEFGVDGGQDFGQRFDLGGRNAIRG